jgi:hypothetical protein
MEDTKTKKRGGVKHRPRKRNESLAVRELVGGLTQSCTLLIGVATVIDADVVNLLKGESASQEERDKVVEDAEMRNGHAQIVREAIGALQGIREYYA